MLTTLYKIRPLNEKSRLNSLTAPLRKLKPMRLISGLVLITSLSACGLISVDDPLADDDKDAPVITKVEPASLTNNELDPNTKTLRFYFNEPLDASTITDLNAKPLSLSSLETGGVDFSVEYQVIAATETTEEQYVLIVTLNTALAQGTTYSLLFNDAITDASDNKNAFQSGTLFQFTTPHSFTVTGVIQGLKGDIKLVLEVPDQQGNEEITVTHSGDSTDFDFDFLVVDKGSYRIKIVHLDTTIGYCATSEASGAINNANARILITCDRVSPLYADNSEWNDYGYENDSDTYAKHLGMKRFLELPASITSCDDLDINDTRGVFEWHCKQRDDGKFIAYNGKLKAGKGLADLIDFTNKRWQKNQITVKRKSDEALISVDSSLAIWWNNPIITIGSGGNTLSTPGGIHIVTSNSASAGADIVINGGSSYAIVVQPGATMYGYSKAASSPNATTIKVNEMSRLWIEGDFQASSKVLLDINDAGYVRIHNASFKNAATGIAFNLGFNSLLSNVLVSDSTGTGIKITGNKKYWGNVHLDNVIAANNALNGIEINANLTTVNNSIAANNGQHGFSVKGLDNKLSGIATYANGGDGLRLDSSRSGTFSHVTSSANTGFGLAIVNVDPALLSEYNNLAHMTLANNVAGAIKNEGGADITGSATDELVNILDAFNSGEDCNTSGECYGMSSGLDTHFTAAVSTDNSKESYDPANLPSYAGVRFEAKLDNLYRSWNNATAFGTSATGPCAVDDTDCRILDWSLKAAATNIRGVNEEPTATTKTYLKLFALDAETDTVPTGATEIDSDTIGNNNGTCEYGEACTLEINYLENTYEVMHDGIGNDNNLCESGETCVYTPNIGSYQGHDSLIPIDGAPSGYTVMKYETNGY